MDGNDATRTDNPTPPHFTDIDVADIVERWWHDHFPGSPVAQLTAAWNHALAAKDDLKRRLAGLV